MIISSPPPSEDSADLSLADRTSLPALKDPTSTLGTLQPWILAFFALAFGYAMIVFTPHEVSDEGFHGPQVWGFFSGSHVLSPYVTTLPTYHLIVGKLLALFGTYTVDLVRFVSMLFASLSLLSMHAVAKHYYGELAGLRMLQVMLMPMAFIFFFLIYADIWVIGALLGAVALCLRERHVLAALMALLALSLRQTAVVWIGFVVVLAACGPSGALHGRDMLRRLWPYLIPLVAFVVFVIWNDGIAMGDRSSHQVGFNLTNLYMLMLCAWAILLPWNVSTVPRIARLLRRRPWVIALVIGGFFLYMATFAVTHPFNHPNMKDYLHNNLLTLLTQSGVWRGLSYVPIAWMALTLAVTRLPEARLYWLYPVIVASVLPHPLIEPRYFLPALVLLMLLRPAQSQRMETLQLLLYMPASAVLLHGTASLQFFL